MACSEFPVSLIIILSIAVQAGLIAHVIKTGRNMLWILAIFFLPLAGSIAYVAVEILPGLFGGTTAAIQAYEGGLKGIFEHDPTLLAGLARAQFAKNDFAAARVTLERLAQYNPDFNAPETQLLHARTLEALDALVKAGTVGAIEHTRIKVPAVLTATVSVTCTRRSSSSWRRLAAA